MKHLKWTFAVAAIFACTSAAANDLAKLIQNHDASTPNFLHGVAQSKCGTALVRDGGISATFNGHSFDVTLDPVSGVMFTTLDGETGVAYLDAAGHVTGGHDAKGNELRPTHHSQAAIDAHVKNDLPTVLAALKTCGWDTAFKQAVSKCDPLNSNGFDYPVGKTCIDDMFSDPGYWGALLGASVDWDAWVGLDTMQCTQLTTCNNRCESAFTAASFLCGTAGLTTGGLICEGVAWVLYQSCKNQCSANWVCTGGGGG